MFAIDGQILIELWESFGYLQLEFGLVVYVSNTESCFFFIDVLVDGCRGELGWDKDAIVIELDGIGPGESELIEVPLPDVVDGGWLHIELNLVEL